MAAITDQDLLKKLLGGAQKANASSYDDMNAVQFEDLPAPANTTPPAAATIDVPNPTPDLPVSNVGGLGMSTNGTPQERELRRRIESQMAGEISQRGEDMQKARDALAFEQQKSQLSRTDLSGLAQMAVIAGAKPEAMSMYKAPVDKRKELQSELEKARDGLATSQSNFLRNQLEKQSAQSSRNDLMQQRMIMTYSDKMGQALDPSKANPSTSFGRAAKTMQAADKLAVLAEQVPDLNKLTPIQMTELAQSSAALLSGGSTTAQSQIEHLLPKTVGRSEAAIFEWFSNKPQGTNQKKFAQMLLETAARERDLAAEQIYKAQQDRLAQYHRFGKAAPEEYNLIKNQYVQPPVRKVHDTVAAIRKSHEIPVGGSGTSAVAKPKVLSREEFFKTLEK